MTLRLAGCSATIHTCGPHMAELYIVRHAQAAFGTHDYDRLTELGHQQARWLGEYFAERKIGFDRILTGRLRRHRETLAGVAAAFSVTPEPERLAGLDEYDADQLLAAWTAQRGLPGAPPDGDRRTHFQWLREALGAWSAGTLPLQEHRSFDAFVDDARAALASVQAGQASRVLIVSSGGPISAMIGAVLGLAPAAIVNVNLQLRNAGICEMRFNARAMHCVSFNNVPHLDRGDRREAITYT